MNAAPVRTVCRAAFFVLLTSVFCTELDGMVRGRHGVAVSADSLASVAGVEIMKEGGNAIDGAVALAFALAVTYPEAGNIGGGGFIVLHTSDGRDAVIDFRETAPARSTRGMFLDSNNLVVEGKSRVGGLAVGVPGSVHGLLTALEKFGTIRRREVLAPAIRLAEDGFCVNQRLALSLQELFQRKHPTIAERDVFSRNGKPLQAGDTLRQPALARTLRLIAEQGNAGFYRGFVAEAIVADCDAAGGVLTKNDLEEYRSEVREPLCAEYRGNRILTVPPPSGGGIILSEILNVLEREPLHSWGRTSPLTWHYFASAAQHAFADRARYLGDPAFVRIPIDSLTSKEYAGRIALSVDPVRMRPSRAVHAGRFGIDNHTETTHFCVADSAGNAVSLTTTLNGLYGSKVYVASAGFFLNNEMDDFAAKPGVPNMFGLTGGEENSIEPRKRMLSSMTPVIVFRGDQPWILTGARGGSRIPTAVAQILLNVIDFGMDLPSAIEAPRLHHQWFPDEVVLEPGGMPVAVEEGLRSLGYTLRHGSEFNGGAEGLQIDGGWMVGAPDAREGGVVVAY